MNEKQKVLLEKLVPKLDIFGAGAVLVGFVLRYMHMKGGSELIIIGFAVLAQASFFQIYSIKKENENLIILKLGFAAAASGMIAALFHFFNWPNSQTLYYGFFGSLLIVGAITLYKQKNTLEILPYNELLKIAGALLVYFVL